MARESATLINFEIFLRAKLSGLVTVQEKGTMSHALDEAEAGDSDNK